MARRREAPKLPDVIERFIKALVVTHKAVSLYPPASNIPVDTARDAAAALAAALSERPELRLAVAKDALFYNELPVFPGNPAYGAFAFELYNRKLADVRFHSGADAKDIVAFLSMLGHTPGEIEAAGGFESRLWELGVGTITVTEAHISLVDGASLAAIEANTLTEPPRTRSEIDELLAAAYGGRARDQITVARFIGDRTAVAEYLTSTFEEGGLSGLLEAGDRFAELAEVAYEMGGGGDRYELLRSLGSSLEELEPDLRRSLLVDEVLPEARTSEAMATVVRQLDLDEVCRMLVDGFDDSQVSREGLARAIRTLALISLADREEVVSSAGAALRGAGFGEGMVSEVLEMTAPSRLTVRERASATGQQDRPADAIFRLMDLAPTPKRELEEESDPKVLALRDEARRGVTDGDVIMALVSLVGLDSRPQQFASTMSILEDSLDLLIERGEIEIAADAADALTAAAASDELEPEQRERLRAAVGRFTKPGDIRAVAHALRLYRPGSAEYEGARRLIDALGGLAIEPLLEQLAEEPDMAVRKSMIDVLSEMAPSYISELGTHTRDPRWFVVRNVVGILGSTKSSAVLPYIERTLRHPDARVRREAIRAFSGINDRLAHEMLIAGLADDDAQNVQLAARYLGAAGVRGSVSALEQVARGEGRGSRDTGPRVEAIEALGKLGASDALQTLEALAGKRALIGAARVRELRAAAESAIARIKASGGGAR